VAQSIADQFAETLVAAVALIGTTEDCERQWPSNKTHLLANQHHMLFHRGQDGGWEGSDVKEARPSTWAKLEGSWRLK
jgi:hypothetical protein